MESDHDPWTRKLSELLDGELDADETLAVELHVDSCPTCAEVLDGLARVREEARSLGGLVPPRDLWPEIRAHLHDAEVLPLPVAPVLKGTRRSAVWSSAGWRAAAVVTLMAAAGITGWVLRPMAPGASPSAASYDGAVQPAAMEAGSAGDAEVAALRAALRDGRAGLDPNTVRLLEKSLATIDRAIDEAQAALRVDPGNAYLERHLEASLERRRSYAREAVALLSSAP